jgi:hypothetical protein
MGHCPPNLVFSCSILPRAVFRKQLWAAFFVKPNPPTTGHFMQFQGVAGCGLLCGVVDFT